MKDTVPPPAYREGDEFFPTPRYWSKAYVETRDVWFFLFGALVGIAATVAVSVALIRLTSIVSHL